MGIHLVRRIGHLIHTPGGHLSRKCHEETGCGCANDTCDPSFLCTYCLWWYGTPFFDGCYLVTWDPAAGYCDEPPPWGQRRWRYTPSVYDPSNGILSITLYRGTHYGVEGWYAQADIYKADWDSGDPWNPHYGLWSHARIPAGGECDAPGDYTLNHTPYTRDGVAWVDSEGCYKE